MKPVNAMGSSLLAVTIAVAAGCGGSQERANLPVAYSFPRSLIAGFQHPLGSPPGADDQGCTPSHAHPRAVVLVHGTFNNRASTWNALSPLLKNRGYCVFSLNFGARSPTSGVGAVTGIDGSSRQLAPFVDRVLALTDTNKVDVVGYSQGGMMVRQYIKFHGGAPKVAALIGLAPSNRGTNRRLSELADEIANTPGIAQSWRSRVMRRLRRMLKEGCQACVEQLADSPFLARLNDPYDTVPSIRYTVISSTHDTVVTPYRSQFLAPGPNVTNITLQARCARDHGDHLSMPFDSVALHYVTNALDPAHATAPRCVRVLPAIGG